MDILRAAAALPLAACLCLLYNAATSGGLPALLIGSVVVWSIWRPTDALLLVSGLFPFVTIALNRVGLAGADWSEALILALAAGWYIRRIASGQALDAGRLDWPIVGFAVVIGLSLMVQLALARAVASDAVFWPELAEAQRHYFTDTTGLLVALHAALRLLEGLFLLALTVTLGRQRELGTRILRMFVIGACGVAVITLARIAGGALRTETPATAFVHLMRTVRLSTPYADVNAAGSYFTLAVLTAPGVAVSARAGFPRIIWMMAGAICAAGLWTSGSRTAVLAALIGVFALTVVRLRGRSLRNALAAVAATALILITVFPNPVLDASAAGALHIRAEMARVSIAMVRTNPGFGVGIGQFYERSGTLIQDPLVRATYSKENAHNNFLQVAAELGLVGICSFALVLFVAGSQAARRITMLGPDLQGGILGLGAFLITALFGHPLLTPEVSIAFWLVLGAVASSTLGQSERPHARYHVRLVGAALLLLVAVTPWRIHSAILSADFDHVGHGVSPWHKDEGGQAYRQMKGDATLFVPSDATSVVLPYRLEKPGSSVLLEFRFRGRVADRVVVTDAEWREWRFMVPHEGSSPRYIPLTIAPVDGEPSNVLLGKLSTTGEH